MSRWRPLLLALAAPLLTGAPVGATHAPDHRFILVGRVTDADGRALTHLPVVVTRLRTGLAYEARTEADGLYLVVVHLHDEDEGDALAVRANGVTLELRARFDARDRRVERGTRVDIRGGEAREDRGAFAETLRAYLAR